MLSSKKLFLFDIDGTACQGGALDPCTNAVFLRISVKAELLSLSYNKQFHKEHSGLYSKFQKLGIKTDYSNFITASYATIHYLKKNY